MNTSLSISTSSLAKRAADASLFDSPRTQNYDARMDDAWQAYRSSPQRRLTSASVLATCTLLVCIGLLTSNAAAQVAPSPASESATSVTPPPSLDAEWIFSAKNQRRFTGAGLDSCQLCHDQPRQEAAWRLGDEKVIWKTDPHHQAYAVLKEEAARRIGEKLGQPQIHRDKRCLACHVGMPIHAYDQPQQLLISEQLASDTRVTDGVSCESCHGPSGTDVEKDWGMRHRLGNWRTLTTREKLESGYYDVRSVTSKTRMCLSCHVGDASQGKVVTHEMFAAGHPPLAGFEVATFITLQRRHWRRLREKPAAIRDPFHQQMKEKDPQYPARDLDPLFATRNMLVAAVTASSHSLHLAADLADREQALPEPLPKASWPELAQFACYNCHHDLQQGSWRRLRGFRLRPGRPDLHEWPNVLTEIALEVGGETTDLATKLKPLVDELNRRPFGRPNEFAAKARTTADWLQQVARRMEWREFERDDAKRTIDAIAARVGESTSDLLDYDSARQLVWAFDVAYRELTGKPFGVGEPRRWYRDEQQNRLPNLTTVQQRLAEFDEMFLLQLTGDKRLPYKSAESDEHLTEAALVTRYDASDFQQRFARLMTAYRKTDLSRLAPVDVPDFLSLRRFKSLPHRSE